MSRRRISISHPGFAAALDASRAFAFLALIFVILSVLSWWCLKKLKIPIAMSCLAFLSNVIMLYWGSSAGPPRKLGRFCTTADLYIVYIYIYIYISSFSNTTIIFFIVIK